MNKDNLIEAIDKYGRGGYSLYDYAVSYPLQSIEFTRIGFSDICPTLAARDYKDPKIVIRKVELRKDNIEAKRLMNIYNERFGTGYAGNVWDKDGICPTLTTMQGGSRSPMVFSDKTVVGCAMRGRNPENPSDRESGIELEQRIEVNEKEVSNTLITVQKDNLLLESRAAELTDWVWEINGKKYLIMVRKLTPKECWRLMGYTDEDFEKAAKVNSNTQLYKQAGNAIVKQCLMAIFKNLNIKGVEK